MLRWRSMVLRKNENNSCLRYRLENFLIADSSAGEFASSRLRAYAETQELLLNKQSTIRATGLKVVFYSRFFTTRGLIASRRYDHLLKDEDREALQRMRDLFLKLGSTDHHFKAIVQDKLSDFEKDAKTSNEQLLKQDVFHQAITEYFQDGTAALTFRRFERAAWEKIPQDKSSFLLDDFNSLNRETLAYARRNLADDIIRTTKNPERFQAFLKRNKLAIAIIIQPLIGAAMLDRASAYTDLQNCLSLRILASGPCPWLNSRS